MISALQRMVAMGLLVILGAVAVNWMVTVRILLPLMHGREPLEGSLLLSVLGGFLSQLGVLLVLPILMWCIAWLLDDRAYRLAFGAAIFTELWHVAILLVTGGFASVVADPVNSFSRLVFLAVAALLGGFAYGHARRMADRS